ncbi:LMBR1 domain-containing protein 2-like [Argonauta hians]
MSAGPLSVEIICTCILALVLIHRYGDWRKQHVLVTLATFVAWYFSLMIIFIIPLDVSSTFYRQCLQNQKRISTTTAAYQNVSVATTPAAGNITSTPLQSSTEKLVSQAARSVGASESTSGCEPPLSHVPDYVLPSLWHVVYWTSQALTWLILPLMQSYSNAGDFTVAGKCKSALIENAIYYGTYLLIFGVCLIYVAASPDLHIDGDKIKVIGVTASNTWGLFLLVLLLGYGLVEVPRTVWNSSKRGHMLSRTQFKIAKLSTEKSEAEEALEDVLEEIKQASESIRYNHYLRKHVDTILMKCPENFRKSIQRNVDDYEDYDSRMDSPTERTLVRLHKRVIRASQIYQRTQCQWNMLMEKVFALEDVANNEVNTDHVFKHYSSSNSVTGIARKFYTPKVEWYWKCLLQPWVMKIVAGWLALMSFLIVWSECLFFIEKPVLSMFAVSINIASKNHDYVYIELTSIITIGFLCFCAYYTVFQIRILNYYYIAPHHQTNEYSLIFTGMMLCRLTPPMCLNFLGLIHLDSHITHVNNLEETAYTTIMGHMDVIAIVSDGFNIYFPIAIVLLCICTYFSLGSRILHFLGFQQFVGDDDMTQELVDEGKELVRREKRRRERKADGEARRKMWNDQFGGIKSTSSTTSESPRRGKIPRSPDENDRTELLRQAEPVDYTGDVATETLEDYIHISQLNTNAPTSYQQSQPPSRYSSVARTGHKPPRGIFDDV